jgi:hypothetical protein
VHEQNIFPSSKNERNVITSDGVGECRGLRGTSANESMATNCNLLNKELEV